MFLTGRSNPQARDEAQSMVSDFRKRGVDYVLAIFDTSTPTSNFHLFLLEWLIEDPKLGLLIKSKGRKSWDELIGPTSADDRLGEILQRARDTQRIHRMSSYVSPGDTALAADFAIGWVRSLLRLRLLYRGQGFSLWITNELIRVHRICMPFFTHWASIDVFL